MGDAVPDGAELPEKNFDAHHKNVLTTFPGEKKIRATTNRPLRCPFMNRRYPNQGEQANRKGHVRYTGTLKLLMEALEKPENLSTARVLAAFNVWLGELMT